MEAERSFMRPDPTSGRGGEMRRNDHGRAIGEGFEKAPPCRSRDFRVDAKAAIELRLGALQRRMHDVAAQDHRCLPRPDDDTDMTGGVPRPRVYMHVVVKGVVGGDQFRLATLHDRQQAVLVIRIGRVSTSQLGDPPVLPFLAGKQVAGVREGRHPSAAEETGVPADMIDMQVRAQHKVDVLGCKAGDGEIGEIGPVFLVIG